MRAIDADALIEKLSIAKECDDCKHNEEPYCRWKPDVVGICEAINGAPTIEPEQRWIPVTDHLPDEDVPVLVTDDAGGMATVDIDSCGRYEDTGERFWYTSQNVTAWMYTVEPYGGEQE